MMSLSNGMGRPSAMTARRLRSTAETSANTTRVLVCRARIWRIGDAMSAGQRAAGRDLVKQGLEQMVVLTVDDDDVGRRRCEALGGGEGREASADNDDTRP